jgi:hypothetical protein
MCVLVFYGIQLTLAEIFYPPAVEVIFNSIVSVVFIIGVFTVSYKVSCMVTEAIKNTVTLAAMQHAARPLHEIATDKSLDLSSASVIVVKTSPKRTRKVKQAPEEVVAESVISAATAVESAPPTPEPESPPASTKKRASRSKKNTQES